MCRRTGYGSGGETDEPGRTVQSAQSRVSAPYRGVISAIPTRTAKRSQSGIVTTRPCPESAHSLKVNSGKVDRCTLPGRSAGPVSPRASTSGVDIGRRHRAAYRCAQLRAAARQLAAVRRPAARGSVGRPDQAARPGRKAAAADPGARRARPGRGTGRQSHDGRDRLRLAPCGGFLIPTPSTRFAPAAGGPFRSRSPPTEAGISTC